MEPDKGPGRAMGQGYEMVSLGLTFAGGIVAFVGGGLLLDRWLHVTPLFTIVGTLLGSALSFTYVYLKLMEESRRDRQDRGKGPKK